MLLSLYMVARWIKCVQCAVLELKGIKNTVLVQRYKGHVVDVWRTVDMTYSTQRHNEYIYVLIHVCTTDITCVMKCMMHEFMMGSALCEQILLV